jgi:hypothetical protein
MPVMLNHMKSKVYLNLWNALKPTQKLIPCSWVILSVWKVSVTWMSVPNTAAVHSARPHLWLAQNAVQGFNNTNLWMCLYKWASQDYFSASIVTYCQVTYHLFTVAGVSSVTVHITVWYIYWTPSVQEVSSNVQINISRCANSTQERNLPKWTGFNEQLEF